MGPQLGRDWVKSLARWPYTAVHPGGRDLAATWAKFVSVVDAKGLYDHLARECPGMARDRRCAIE
eukprot:5258910-Lingulodinium_polyedra.AAC.1